MQPNRATSRAPSAIPLNPSGSPNTALDTGLRLLSLDGGGIRGLSSLLILEMIMHRIKASENLAEPPLPCEYFDLIGGTSTGGIIAIMLGRLRMSVEQAIECYDDLSGKVFRRSKLLGDGKYKATMLEKVIKSIVEERTGDSETSLLDDGTLGGKCRMFVCSMNAHSVSGRRPVLFRSYLSPKTVPISCKVWEAARATSAAPTFFKRMLIGPDTRREPFIDGGVGQNNPTEQVLSEAQVIFPGRPVACLISIGTGQPEIIGVGKPTLFERNVIPVGAIKAMVEMATDCEETAERMHKYFENRPKTYFRFNVDQGLQTVKLDNWERMDEVSAHTRQYMEMYEVGKRLDDAVMAMVGRSAASSTFTSNTILDETPVLVEDSERGEILAWISPVDVFAKHFDVFRTLQPGTGQWLLDAAAFQTWMGGSGKALWLVGIPGAGKTVLASLAIEHLRTVQRKQSSTSAASDIGVAWVYYNYKEASTQTPDAVLLSIARQLAGSSTDLYTDFKSAYKRDPHNRPFAGQLISSGLLMKGFKEVFVVIDALDECAQEHRDAFLRMMAHLQASGANILITSRDHVADYVNVSSRLVDVQRIEIENTEDITHYVRTCMEEQTRLAALVRSKPELSQEIVTEVVRSCEGMFLMATLQIQRLQKYTNVGSLRAALGVLPTTVDGIYDAAIHRIESDDWSEDALRILSYLVHARRPLALEELQHFLAVQPSHTQLHEEYITDRDTLVSMCAGLVVVDDKTRIIRLVHYTAQEYLDKRQEARFSLGDEELGRICLAYLSFDEWRIRTKWDALQRSKILSRYALLDYIVHYWHLHVLNHQEALQEPLSAFLKNDRLIHAYHHWCHFLKQHQATTFDDLADQKGIHVAAASGLLLAVEWLIPDNHRNLRTTLISASEGGHIAVVKMLLQHGVDVDAFDRAGDTALTKASLGGHDTMVKLLFEHGADAEARTRFAGGTALTIASEYGHSAVVKHLLEHGANIEACTPFECTGLMIASQRGHDTVVKLLLEHGADIEAQDKYHSTALIWASQCGEDVVVNLLLEHGADIEAQDKDKCTALLMATRGGHVEVMKLLLEHGANIETQGKDKRTPLLVAAHHSSREMVELLLEHGADSEAQDKDECTALILATRGGYVEVVKLLLVYGADIEAQDKDECTAAIAASICGYGAVMELLLEHGADFSIKGDQWRTALVAASRRDDTAALHLLLENGGDEDESWRDSWHTALIAAIYRDFKKDWTRGKVVKLLLGKGDARGGKDRTASRLIAASADGDEAAVQKLLAGGGEVNTEFRHPPTPDMYPTALIAALCAGHAATVKLLLQHGADVSTLDIEGKTALTQASRMGYDAVVEVLLQHGADVNAASDYYGTALRTAFMSGHTEVVKVLLTHIAGDDAFARETALMKGIPDIGQRRIEGELIRASRE